MMDVYPGKHWISGKAEFHSTLIGVKVCSKESVRLTLKRDINKHIML